MEVGQRSRSTPPKGVLADLPGETATADLERAVATLETGLRNHLQQQNDAFAGNVRFADALVKYGGALLLWIVGLAAFLLFHDEKERDGEGIERLVQTHVLEALPLGVCLTTPSGVILYANPVAEAAFGYRSGEMLDRNLVLLEESSRGDSGHTISEILDELAPGRVWSGRLSASRKDGAILTAASWITTVEFGRKKCHLLIQERTESAPADSLAAGSRSDQVTVSAVKTAPVATSTR